MESDNNKLKNSFIKSLFNNPSATKKDKDRILDLVLKERDKGFVTEEQVREMIEEYLVDNDNGTKLLDKNPIKRMEEKLSEPEQTYKFLSSFSEKECGLKNLTHDFNYEYIEYDKFIEQCKRDFYEIVKKYPNVPDPLIRRIEEFAFKESPSWFIRKGEEKITFNCGWSEPSFIEWYKTNKIHPSKDQKYKKEMIDPFKNTIQVRADSENLKEMLDSLIEKLFGENKCCNVEVKPNVSDLQFYTDVDKLGCAIYKILSTMKEYSEKNFCDKIVIESDIDGDYKVIKITHIGSESTKRSDDKDYLGGDGKSIKNSLWGLCNYEIHAIFKDGPYRKIILSDNKEEYKKGRYPIDKNNVLGYTHVLKFY